MRRVLWNVQTRFNFTTHLHSCQNSLAEHLRTDHLMVGCGIMTYYKKYVFGLRPSSWHRAPETLGISQS